MRDAWATIPPCSAGSSFSLSLVAFWPAARRHAAPAAPGFKVTTLDGRTIDSRDLIGKKVIVLRFQASYCKPCVKESAAFGRVVERYRDRDVVFVAIHVQDTMSDVRRFVKANNVTYPIAVDPKPEPRQPVWIQGLPVHRRDRSEGRDRAADWPARVYRVACRSSSTAC